MAFFKGKSKNKSFRRHKISKNLVPVDLDEDLSMEKFEGYYILDDGTILHLQPWTGDNDDEEYDEGEEPDGGVYWDDPYFDGGVKTFMKGETMKDFDQSGFLSSPMKYKIVFDGNDSDFEDFDELFNDYDLDEEEKIRRLNELVSRHKVVSLR